MKEENIFYECQRPSVFVRTFLLIIYVINLIIFVLGVSFDIKPFESFFSNIYPMIFLNITLPLLPGIWFLIYNIKLIINDEGIIVKGFPLFKAKFFAWKDIELAYIRKYRALNEYGGWGYKFFSFNILRIGLMRKNINSSAVGYGKAITISGNMGLQLVLNSGEKWMLGTHRSEEMTDFLKRINKLSIVE